MTTSPGITIRPPIHHAIQIAEVDGVTFYSSVAVDGWPTGPCRTEAKVVERYTAYEKCEEVSEAAPGQASRAQMQAFFLWASETWSAVDDGHALLVIGDAIIAGLHTTEWVRASMLLAKLRPGNEVFDAGGALVRRRLPETRIPSRSV